MQKELLKPSSIVIYCDFDGTITEGDLFDFLLENLADPAWREVEDQWDRGEISARECMGQQASLIRGGWPAVVRALDKAKLDPTFAQFANWCKKMGIQLHIASDGPDRVIKYMLDRENIQVDFIWANRLMEAANGDFTLEFPYAVEGCLFGNCKCALLEKAAAPTLKVVIGDGASDFCFAKGADLIFAKSKLLTYCRKEGIACTEFQDFTSINNALEARCLSACV